MESAKKIKILVFPCGSEVGLEIHRALNQNSHFIVYGASSVDNHGEFLFENYVPNTPFISDKNFVPFIKKLISDYKIDLIFPAMDSVARALKPIESELGALVIGSSAATTLICSSKIQIYRNLNGVVPLPKWTDTLDFVTDFPVFIKPDDGYGSRNIMLAENISSAREFINRHKGLGFLFCENLPGNEYTIDCFTNKHGKLLFVGPRERSRISNGISVRTMPAREYGTIFNHYAKLINDRLKFRGAWFFQMKESDHDGLKLLEVSTRLGGSSSLFRMKGINFAALSAYDALGLEVNVCENNYDLVLDRALCSKYKLDIYFDKLYIDYDDTIIIGGSVNYVAVGLLYKLINDGKKIILLTKHDGDLRSSLALNRLSSLFDQVIHIKNDEKKSDFIDPVDSIFIDDSFVERASVKKDLAIPVFSVDMIESLL